MVKHTQTIRQQEHVTEYVRFHKVFEKNQSSEPNTKYSKYEVRTIMYFNIPNLK